MLITGILLTRMRPHAMPPLELIVTAMEWTIVRKPLGVGPASVPYSVVPPASWQAWGCSRYRAWDPWSRRDGWPQLLLVQWQAQLLAASLAR